MHSRRTVQFIAGFETVQSHVSWEVLQRAPLVLGSAGRKCALGCLLQGKKMHKVIQEEQESLCPG